MKIENDILAQNAKKIEKIQIKYRVAADKIAALIQENLRIQEQLKQIDVVKSDLEKTN